MKILHTSDWHIGKKLYEKELIEDHNFFFNQLISIIEKDKIDILIVAGDIFDTAYPSNSSLKLYYQTLKKLQNTELKNIIITGGNHDSRSTLNAPQEVLAFLNIHVIGGVPKTEDDQNDYDKQIIEIKDKNNETKLVVVAIPFLRERDIRKSIAGESFETKRRATIDGIKEHFNILSEKTFKYREKNIPVIATGHLFVAGATPSESEREIYVGNQEKLSGDFLTDKFDYLALGHIHKPYIVGKNPAIRYSGSPIPLSFSEYKDKKSVVIINTEKKDLDIETKIINPYRNLYRFKGILQEVISKFEEKITDNETTDLVEIEVREEKFSSEIKHKYQEFIEKYSDIIISKKLVFNDQLVSISELYKNKETLSEIDDFEVFTKLLDKNEILDKERKELEESYKYLRNQLWQS